jgi:C1A family cysteine protease
MFVHDAWGAFANNGSAVNSCLPWSGLTTCPNTCDNGTPVTIIKANPTSVYEAHNQTGIQQELLDGGSVSATMTVYADFLAYQSGVYYKTNNTIIGIQTVKIYGWGVNATGTQYWICANSLGSNWGMGGSFQIAFGNCGLDALGVIGLLNLN